MNYGFPEPGVYKFSDAMGKSITHLTCLAGLTVYTCNLAQNFEFFMQVEKLLDIHQTLVIVTFHAKTYTNGFVLNGQKPTANQRVANGFSNGFKAFSTLSTGAQKLSTACNFFQTVCDDFSNAFS